MRRIRRFCAEGGRGPRPVRRLARTLLTRARALRVPFAAVPALVDAWPRVRALSGKRTLRLLADQLWLAAACGITPVEYYLFGLFLDARRGEVDQYLYQHQVSALVAGLGHPDLRDVNDKVRFAARVAAAHLNVAGTEAVFRDGTSTKPDWTPPAVDLFVKPVCGSHGRGASAYRYSHDSWQRTGGTSMTAAALIESLAARSRREPLLVQRRLLTCGALANLTLNGLVTARVVTALDEQGQPEHLLSVLKIPLGGRDTDNHGLACPIDEHGRLGRALSYRVACDGFDTHPDTGAAITGRTLSDWPRVRELAIQAHRTFSDVFALGWDVAMAHDGPVLLEANAGWDAGTIQRPHGRPLGRTRFAALAAARIASLDR